MNSADEAFERLADFEAIVALSSKVEEASHRVYLSSKIRDMDLDLC